MKNRYLLSYLREYYNDPKMDKVLDYFKINLDWYLYDFGRQITRDTETRLSFLYDEPKPTLKKRMILKLRPFKRFLKKTIKSMSDRNIVPEIVYSGPTRKVLSFAPMTFDMKKMFAAKNIEVIQFEEMVDSGHPRLKDFVDWYNSFSDMPFNERLQLSLYSRLDDFFVECQREFKEYCGLFVTTNDFFFHKFFIDVFKSLSIPSFIFLHGLPGRYSLNENNRGDYLLVWGDEIKRNFIAHGFDSNKILVTGRLNENKIPHFENLRNSFDDVLVMTSCTLASQQSGWDWDTFPIQDRSLLLTYIYSIERVLKNNGIRKARLRPHPINNKNWVRRFIDTDFFEIDYEDLDRSLGKATLVIGPTSTTFLQSIMSGVSYIVYEPGNQGYNISNHKLVPPFDGSEDLLKIAQTEEELDFLLKSHYCCNPKILDKYVLPFSIDNIPL